MPRIRTTLAKDSGTYPLASRTALQLARAPAVARVLDKFLAGGGSGIAVGRSGTTYSLYRGIAPGLFSKFDLVVDSAEPGGYALHQLRALTAISPMLSKAYDDASVASSGTWTLANQTVTDAVTTNGSATLGSPSGKFSALDVGRTVTGTGIQASTTISAFVSPAQVTMSKTATADGTALSIVITSNLTYATAAASKTFTTPGGTTTIGLRQPQITNGGLFMKVTIDGDATLADGLLTAQQAVTANLLDSTVLVANGGTLNPTDRVFDSYAASSGATSYDTWIGLAAGLTAGVHTVVVTCTTYNRKGLTSQRSYVGGFSYGTASSQPTDANTVQMPIASLCQQVSAWEHACEVTPVGGTTPTLLGNVHGYEIEDSFTLAVDGTTQTLTDGQILAATRDVTVTRVSHFVHPDTGATVVANVAVIYTMGRFGLTVDDTITPTSSAGQLSKAYAMMPLNGATSAVVGAALFTRANLLEYPGGPLTFTGSNGDSYYGSSKSAAAWSWGGKFGVLMHMPDVESYTNDWALSTPYTRVEDRNGGITKAYIGRNWGVGAAEAFPTLHHRTTYTVGYFSAGAEATLAIL